MQFVHMKISVHIEHHIIELMDNDGFTSLVDGYVSAPSFKIRGRRLGITTLFVSPLSSSSVGSLPQSKEI